MLVNRAFFFLDVMRYSDEVLLELHAPRNAREEYYELFSNFTSSGTRRESMLNPQVSDLILIIVEVFIFIITHDYRT